MADTPDRALTILIRILTDAVGADQANALIAKYKTEVGGAAAATGEMAEASSGLATAIPDLTAKTQQFVISTESEYRAVLKTAEALRVRIAVRQAANLSVTEEIQKLAALDAALSTESALRVAETMETRAAAAATAADTAAKDANTAATWQNMGAQEQQLFMGRKMVSLFDEISRGQFGQVTATFGSFLKTMGTGLGGTFVMLTALMAGSAILRHFRHAGEGANKLAEGVEKVREAEGRLTEEVWENQREAINRVREAEDNYRDSLNQTESALTQLQSAEQNDLAILQAQKKAHDEILAVMEKEALAAAAGDKVKEAEIRSAFGDLTSQQQLAFEANQIAIREDYLAAQKKEQQKAGAAYAAAHAAAQASRAQDVKSAVDEAEAAALKTTGEKSIGELRNMVKDAQKRAADYGNQPSIAYGPEGQPQQTAAGAARLQAAGLAGALASYDAAAKAADAHAEKLHKLEKTEGEAQQRLDALNKAIETTTSQLHTAESVFGINQSAAKSAAATTAAGESTRASEQIARFIEGGGKPSSQQLAFLENWASELAGQQVSLNTAIQMAEAGARNNNAFMAQVQRLAAMLNGLDFSQIQHLADIVTGLQGKMQILQTQLDATQSR